MGAVISIINLVIDTVRGFKENARQDQKDEDRRRLDTIKDPIQPPRYFTSIQERDVKIPDSNDPFSTKSIREALANDIIPIGYSLEQLEFVGFGPEVKQYKSRNSENIANKKTQLKQSLTQIVKLLEQSFPDLAENDRRALELAGLLNDQDNKNLILKINGWIDAIDKNRIDLDILDNILKLATSRSEVIQDALGAFQLKQDIQSKISSAEDKRDSTILEFINRSLSYR